MLAKLSDMVDRRYLDKLHEPIYQIQDLIHFLWFDHHQFLLREPNRMLRDNCNSGTFTFMPFPLVQSETRRRNVRENGSL